MNAAPHAAPAACENCSTALQGGYCHVCGQHAVNPMRHFAHAVEDVFESFWHLDGRVFRTLRDLFVPGRVACNYLDGQRVRYIAPLRLFVVLTVLTFFVGQLAAAAGDGTGSGASGEALVVYDADETGRGAIQRATTAAEVEAAVTRQVAELREARAAAKSVPFAAAGLAEAEREVRRLADRRLAQLRNTTAPAAAAAPAPASTSTSTSTSDTTMTGRVAPAPRPPASAAPVPAPRATPASVVPAGSGVDAPSPDAAVPPPAAASPSAASDAERVERQNADARRGMQELAMKLGTLRDPKAPWHERDNPVDARIVPAFADAWFNHRLANAERNVLRVNRDGETTLLRLALAAVPPALFVLVPLFALLLRGLYLLTPRGYLEHLVVALYSHAFMLMVLLATFAMTLLRAVVPEAGAVATGTRIVQTAAWAALPIYLFVMQRRVYRQHWLATFGKYLLLGFAYLMLVGAVVVYSVLAGISSGA